MSSHELYDLTDGANSNDALKMLRQQHPPSRMIKFEMYQKQMPITVASCFYFFSEEIACAGMHNSTSTDANSNDALKRRRNLIRCAYTNQSEIELEAIVTPRDS